MSIRAADLFCGAGGTSEGLARACLRFGLGRPSLVAVNHWEVAVAAHRANHPWADHYCARVESLDPRRVVPDGRLDILAAGVECTHHSQARGGRPMCDQSRASAWHVLHWCEHLQVRDVLIENVPEFLSWGPIDEAGRPIKDRRGETFRAFVQALESLDYRVEWRILTAADFGDPTTRRRFFLRARAHRGAITWPTPTHAEEPGEGVAPWRTARSILDWANLGTSIIGRARPLAPRTLDRIAEGIRRFCQPEHVEPFLLMLTHGGRLRSVDRPMPTVTGAHRGEIALVRPFILPHDQFQARNGLALVDSIDRPMRTVGARNGRCQWLVTPFVLPYYGTGVPHGVDEPLGTVTTRDRFALVTPDGLALDILFRMLTPRELARAQGFPDTYRFAGRKADQVRQIGNAVPVHTAEALCAAAIGDAA